MTAKRTPPRERIVRVVDGHEIVFDRETSTRMGGIRQRDTKPELLVRRRLAAHGLRYRTSNRDLPGSPDIANRTHRWAIYVHGCYWHRHPGCSRATTPKRNTAFWIAKFDANVARDARAKSELVEQGYQVLTVWECEAESAALDDIIETFIAGLDYAPALRTRSARRSKRRRSSSKSQSSPS